MKAAILALALCLAISAPASAQTDREAQACGKFFGENQANNPKDAFEAGMAALERGNLDAAQAAFDRALAAPRSEADIILISSLYGPGACGFPTDYSKVAQAYRAGADRGWPSSLLNLALLKWSGQGVPQDREAATHLFRQGLIKFEMLGGRADIPDLEGLTNHPAPPELLKEFDWVNRLATTPGMGLQVGDELLASPSPDPVSACRYMAFSFDRHPDAETAYRLGMMHFEGEGLQPSVGNALRFLSRATTLDHPLAMAEIGRRMASDQIPSRNEWNALAWLLRAEMKGAPVSGEVGALKQRLPPPVVREAKMQAHSVPPLDFPRSSIIRDRCRPATDN